MGPLHSPLVEDQAGVLRRVVVAHQRCGVVISADLVVVDDSSLLQSSTSIMSLSLFKA